MFLLPVAFPTRPAFSLPAPANRWLMGVRRITPPARWRRVSRGRAFATGSPAMTTVTGAASFSVMAFRHDDRQVFEVVTQILCENDGAASAFYGAQRPRTNRLVERRPTGTRD